MSSSGVDILLFLLFLFSNFLVSLLLLLLEEGGCLVAEHDHTHDVGLCFISSSWDRTAKGAHHMPLLCRRGQWWLLGGEGGDGCCCLRGKVESFCRFQEGARGSEVDEVGGEVKELAGNGFVVERPAGEEVVDEGKGLLRLAKLGEGLRRRESRSKTKIEPSPSRGPWGTSRGTRGGKQRGGGMGRGSSGDALGSRSGELRQRAGEPCRGAPARRGDEPGEATRECWLCREFAEGGFAKMPLRQEFRDGGSI